MNEAYNLELLHRIIDNWNLPLQESTNKFEQNLDVIPWLYFLPTIYTPSFSQFKKTELRAAGAWNCGRIAIAIEMYSQKHGKLPESLDALVPEYLDQIPTEPFYGNLLNMKRTATPERFRSPVLTAVRQIGIKAKPIRSGCLQIAKASP